MNFLYEAKNATGKHITGTIDAPSEEQAILSLQQKNLYVLHLDVADTSILKKDLFSYFNRPSKKNLVIFTRQLATLMDADVPLLEGLTILARQAEQESFRRVILTVTASIQGGASLSVALGEHDHVFERFYTSLVHVGEVSGKMHETLLYLADYLERNGALTAKIRGAIFYPTFVLTAMVIVAVIMMTTVIPQLLEIIKDSGVTDLPLPTRMLVFVSDIFQRFWALLLIFVLGGLAAIVSYVKTPSGKVIFDRIKISVPRFGKIIRNLYLARMAETLATLVRSGVPILEGIEITATVVGNEIYRGILLEAKKSVQSGGSLSGTLKEYSEFPTLVSSMLATGEQTGRTDYMLTSIFTFYKTEAENDIQNLSQLIEPVLILILGVGIGLLVAAILLPIYSLVNVA